MMACAYNQAYGIIDHIKQDSIDANPATPPSAKRPFATIAVHEAEDLTEYMFPHALGMAFVEKEIGKLFNISWDDFLDRSPDEVHAMIKLADQYNSRQSARNNSALKNMEDELNKK